MKQTVEAFIGIPAGLAAPLVYAGAVFVGGVLTPGYSQLSQTISELTAVGAPAARPLTTVLVAYNLLLGCFAVALPAVMPTTRAHLVTTAAAILMTLAIVGIAMSAPFPLEGTGVAATAASWKHVALAAVASVATVGAMLALAIAEWHTPRWRWLSIASVIGLVVVAGSGLWTATAVAHAWPLAGLAERLTIGTFMTWIFVLTLALARERLFSPTQAA